MDAELHQRTTYLNSLIENSPLGIVVFDREGRVELVNDAFTRLSQYEQGELVGSDLDSVFVPSKDEHAASWASQVFAGNTLQQTVRRLRKDGTVLDLELTPFAKTSPSKSRHPLRNASMLKH
jgi:PAS domain S-box-containing protein